jgi:membrane associated rhomboid family serine protease
MRNAIVQVFIFSEYCIITIITGMTSYEDVSVSHAAHFAGGLAGLLVGILVLINVKKLAWETKLWWLVAIVLSILITACLSFHIFSSNYFPVLKS